MGTPAEGWTPGKIRILQTPNSAFFGPPLFVRIQDIQGPREMRALRARGSAKHQATIVSLMTVPSGEHTKLAIENGHRNSL